MLEEEEEEKQLQLKNNNNKEKEEKEKEKYTTTEYVEWVPPELLVNIPPLRNYHFYRHFRASSKSNPNNFLQGIKWSPDGSCFVTSTNDNTLPIFSLPTDGYGYNGNADDTGDDSYSPSIVLNEGEAIYDYCWYPYMSASDPLTCVFASTTRDHPIHLWDSSSGELRCTYRAYDAMDEITAAFCIGFNPGGTKIFAGYNKAIRVFDIHRPGREFKQHSTVQGNKEGQAGMISAIAFSPGDTGMLATGSYNKTTAIYREDNLELLYVLHGQEGGVTHVQFSRDGNYLYTGGRKDPYILCWDIRKAVDIVYKVYRSSENTNQRILFDIDPTGQYLGTGGQDGMVHLYNLQTGQWVSCFQAALDTVNGFSFHPYLPMAASSSGHRRYVDVDDSPKELSLSADENCASVWSFSVASTMDEVTNHVDSADLNCQ